MAHNDFIFHWDTIQLNNHDESVNVSSSNLNDVADQTSDDEEFSPGQLIIDPSEYEHNQTDTIIPTGNVVMLGPNDFKGLTFVGKMDVPDPPDTVCLYSYHWGPTHLDIITRNNEGTIIPMKNIYGRVVPGLTRNSVSNRVPKIGGKTVALSDAYISILKKLQLPITARSHYLPVSDFIRVCIHYKRTPPPNLAKFIHVTSHTNPVEILKSFNSEKPSSLNLPVLAPPQPFQWIRDESSVDNQMELGALVPENLNANLAVTLGDSMSRYHHNSLSPSNSTTSSFEQNHKDIDPNLVHSVKFTDGTTISIIQQEDTLYVLNTELSLILPQASQNVIAPLRSILSIPLEYASKPVLNALKAVHVIGVKVCRLVIFKVSDVIRMHYHWNLPVPQYLIDINNRKMPNGFVDRYIMSFRTVESKPNKSNQFTELMSPSGARVDLGMAKKKDKERKNSHSSFPPLNDLDLEYVYMPWGSDKSLTLLLPPQGEPHIAIAELVDKIFIQRCQVSLQKRTRFGIPTIPATSLQIHALRARGSIDPSSGYSKLIPLSGVVKLAKESNIFIPPNVIEQCKKYVSMEQLEFILQSPSKSMQTTFESSPIKMEATLISDDQSVLLRADIAAHPDVVHTPGYVLKTVDGVLFQVNWGKAKIAVFTSARNVSYVGLYQIYDVLFKHLVTRMNFKMRMRKLGIKSIRAPSFIRQGLIKLDALPSSSPVCGLLRIFEMEKLVKSYEIAPPQVFYDLFLNNYEHQEMEETDIFKDFDNSEEKLIVSFPRALISVSKLEHHYKPVHHPPPPPSGGLSSKTSMLQSLAKKISQKNHRLAAASSTTTTSMGTRNCHSCGKSHPLAKKRCEDCGSFLTGYPCPMCGVINYSRCSKCIKCGTPLDPSNRTNKQSPLKKTDLLNNDSSLHHEHPNSESSDDSHSPELSSYLVAPPIRNAALKSMFPKGNESSSSSLVTKTIFSGNLTSSRNCQECGTLNPRKAKKCQQCRAPIQGRPCPKCSRPNHSHSVECFKCGATLPPTATKWILGGRIFRTTHDSNKLGMTAKQLKKAEANRAELNCMRCQRIKKYGRFKCGRCGDLYLANSIYSTPQMERISTDKVSHESRETKDPLLQLAENLVLVGVGEELLPTLADKEEEIRKVLYPAEEELNAAEEHFQSVSSQKEEKMNIETDIQTELNQLILHIEQLNERFHSIEEREKEAIEVMEVCPDQVRLLEMKINAYIDLHD